MGTRPRMDHSIRNAMLVAALAGLASAVRRELDHGRIHQPPRIGETALGAIAQECTLSMAKLLIDAGAEGGFFRLPNANVPNGAWDAARTTVFEAITGIRLSEREGWLFMVCLKLVRMQSGKPDADHPSVAAHRDTVRGDGHIGTLVLILNSEYTGGELEITHSGQTEVVTGPYSWVAMYGDCLHKINPVTSGTRVSLIFDIINPVRERGRHAAAQDGEDEESVDEESESDYDEEDGDEDDGRFWEDQYQNLPDASDYFLDDKTLDKFLNSHNLNSN